MIAWALPAANMSLTLILNLFAQDPVPENVVPSRTKIVLPSESVVTVSISRSGDQVVSANAGKLANAAEAMAAVSNFGKRFILLTL